MIDIAKQRAWQSLLVWTLCGALAACAQGDGSARQSTADHTLKTVRVGQVEWLDTAQTYALTGVTRASERAQLSFQVSGTLSKRPVDLGSQVAKGELMAQLSQPELKPAAAAAAANVDQIASELAQARRDLARVRTLVDKDAATGQELENARSRRDSLSASLAGARADSQRARNSASELRLISPIAGSVEQVYFEPGEFVSAGQPVVSLSGAQSLEVEIGVPEQLVGTLTTGKKAQLTLPFFDDRSVQGTITRVSPAAGGVGQLFNVVISLEAAQLRPGLSVEWHIEGPRRHGLLLPARAIASPGASHKPRVYVVRDGVVHAVPVSLGVLIGNKARVQGQLNAGDNVVVVGLNNLTDGQTVHVLDRGNRD